MIEDCDMEAPSYGSSVVHSYGFRCDEEMPRGAIRVQFKKPEGELTSLGEYLDVPRALWMGLQHSKDAIKFINEQLKPYFEWRRL